LVDILNFGRFSSAIPPDLGGKRLNSTGCGFTLIFEVEVQNPGGFAPPFVHFPFKVPHFAH
jgi:hypothetical protein